jgi:nucleoside-diphosphate-sugar epimerase
LVDHITRRVGSGVIEIAPHNSILDRSWFDSQIEGNPQWREASELRIVVLNAAGVVGGLDQSGFHFNSTDAPQAVLYMSQNKKTRVFVAGTSFEYGLSGESTERLDPYDSPLRPSEDYGQSKKLGFDSLRRHIALQDNLAYGRIFQAWGGKEPPSRLIPTVLRNAEAGQVTELNSGLAVRDFISATQVCDQIYKFFGSPWMSRRIVNICIGEALSVEQFCKKLLVDLDLNSDFVKSNRRIEHPYTRLVGVPLDDYRDN